MNSLSDANAETAAAAGGEPGAGEVLQRARCAAGLSVEDVARQMKFGARQIESLEAGRYGELPGSTMARGMVRNYARLLKLDPEPLVQRMAGLVARPAAIDTAVPFRRPIPFSDSARHVNLGYALLSLAVLGLMLAVVLGWPGDPARDSKLTFIPAGQVAAVPPVEPERVPVAAVGTPLALVAPVQPAPAAATASAPRISLRFERASWVEVRGGDGRVLTSGLNAAGTTRVVEGIAPFKLVIGNAEHVQLHYGERQVDLAQHVRLDVARLTLE